MIIPLITLVIGLIVGFVLHPLIITETVQAKIKAKEMINQSQSLAVADKVKLIDEIKKL